MGQLESHNPATGELVGAVGTIAPSDVDGVADQPLLPPELAGVRFYEPTDRGFEARLRERIEKLRRRFGG